MTDALNRQQTRHQLKLEAIKRVISQFKVGDEVAYCGNTLIGKIARITATQIILTDDRRFGSGTSNRWDISNKAEDIAETKTKIQQRAQRQERFDLEQKQLAATPGYDEADWLEHHFGPMVAEQILQRHGTDTLKAVVALLKKT